MGRVDQSYVSLLVRWAARIRLGSSVVCGGQCSLVGITGTAATECVWATLADGREHDDMLNDGNTRHIG